MKTGLLWFDDDPRKELEEKVLRAAAHYERKYGQAPNLCFVHPSAFNGNGNGNGKRANKRGKKGAVKAGEVEIRPGRSVLQHHFWLGMAEEKSQASRRKSR
jgi:hypothetical protein